MDRYKIVDNSAEHTIEIYDNQSESKVPVEEFPYSDGVHPGDPYSTARVDAECWVKNH